MKKLILLILIALLGALVAGCSEQATLPTLPPEPNELGVELGASVTSAVVPFWTTSIPRITGGVQPYDIELFYDDEIVSDQAVKMVKVVTVAEHTLRLKVTDAAGVVVEASVTITGLEPVPGAPLTAQLFTADYFGTIPFTAAVFGIAHGGVEPYSYQMLLDGLLIYEDNIGPIYITGAGNHVVTFVVTDAEQHTEQASVNILGLEPESEPLMRIGFVATPTQVYLGNSVTLITGIFGGQPPFVVQQLVDGVVVSTEPMSVYQTMTLGTHLAETRVTDATGMTSETTASFTVVAAPVYVPPLTIDVTATPWHGVAPFYTALHADVRGGRPPYTVDWFDDGNIDIGDTENLYRLIDEQGERLFTARVTDADGKTASASVVVIATAPNIVCWMVPTSIKVGPNDHEDGASVNTGQPSGQNHLLAYFRLDVADQDRGNVIMEIVYSDGSRRYWTIPDVLSARPSYVLVDLGEALVEPTMRVNLYYTGDYQKCDGWYRLLAIHGWRVVPSAK